MVARAVKSMFFPQADGSISFYPLGVGSQGFVLPSSTERDAIHTWMVRYYSVTVWALLLASGVPVAGFLVLVEVVPDRATGQALEVLIDLWVAVFVGAMLGLELWWYSALRRWKRAFQRTQRRLTLTMAGDNAAAKTGIRDLVRTGIALGLGTALASAGLVGAWIAGSAEESVLHYLQLWLFAAGVAWIVYVLARRRQARRH